MEDELVRDLFILGLRSQKAKEDVLANMPEIFEEVREKAQRIESASKELTSDPRSIVMSRTPGFVPTYYTHGDHVVSRYYRECGKDHIGAPRPCPVRNRKNVKCGLRGCFASQCPKSSPEMRSIKRNLENGE